MERLDNLREGTKSYKGYSIQIARDMNMNGTTFYNVFKISKNSKSVYGVGAPFSSKDIDGWTENEVFNNAKKFIDKLKESLKESAFDEVKAEVQRLIKQGKLNEQAVAEGEEEVNKAIKLPVQERITKIRNEFRKEKVEARVDILKEDSNNEFQKAQKLLVAKGFKNDDTLRKLIIIWLDKGKSAEEIARIIKK